MLSAPSRRQVATIVAVLSVVGVYALLLPLPDSNQNSHYALVKALARGTAEIGETRGEVGDLGTWDISVIDGKVYSDKAPGLALAALPAYGVLRVAGVRTSGDPIYMLWALHLWVVVLPALVLLALVARLGDQLEAGLGAAAAVSIGLGSLLLPYGAMLFVHVLSATLGFAAFVVLWREREGSQRAWLVAVAGALAGLSVVVDYPLAVAAAVLGAYAIARPGWLRRGLVYTVGLAVGVAPMLLYNAWAFGSPTRLSRTGAIYAGEVLDHGFYGMSTPRFSVVVDLLLWGKYSLLVPGPILVAGAVGAVLLYRRGMRAEALVIGAIALLAPVYTSGHVGPFGDVGAGPRYLITALPFLAVPLAIAYRRFPATTAALAGISIAWMLAITVTHPQASWDGQVLDKLTSPGFESYTRTVTEFVGVTGPARLLPLALLLVLAIGGAAVAAQLRRPTLRDVSSAAVAVGAWALVAIAAPALLDSNLEPTAAALLALALAFGLIAGVWLFEVYVRRSAFAVDDRSLAPR